MEGLKINDQVTYYLGTRLGSVSGYMKSIKCNNGTPNVYKYRRLVFG